MPRYECGIEGLEANWVDVSDAWTRRESREAMDADEDATLEILRHKLTGCHLETTLGPIDDPALLTVEALDEMDVRIVRFLGTVLMQAIRHTASLGNLSGRLSSNGAGGAAAPKKRASRHRTS